MFNFDSAEIDITKEEILSKINELDIFKRYVKYFEDVDKGFKSEFYLDNNPGCRIYLSNNNCYYYKDFGNGGEHLDCFSYVQKKFNVNFHESLRIIANDFNIKNLKTNINPKVIVSYDAINVPIKPKSKASIEIFPQNYNLNDYNYWNQFGIPLQLLEDYDVFSCKWVYVHKNGNTIVSEYRKSNPIYAYRFTNDNKYSYKIYFPMAPKKNKWLFSGSASKDIEGYDQLDESGDILILTKSLKDCMCYRLFGINAISIQGETNKLSKELVDKLLKRFKTVIINYDNDSEGIKSADLMKEQFGFDSFVFTEAKDLSDVIKLKGIDYAKKRLEKVLKVKLKINKKYE